MWCAALIERPGGGYDGTADGEGAVACTIPGGVSQRSGLRGVFVGAALAGWFRLPRVCGKGRAAALKSRAYTYECSSCGRQTSITAGTAMHRTKLPLTTWFWAAHLMATHSNGMSARQLEDQ